MGNCNLMGQIFSTRCTCGNFDNIDTMLDDINVLFEEVENINITMEEEEEEDGLKTCHICAEEFPRLAATSCCGEEVCHECIKTLVLKKQEDASSLVTKYLINGGAHQCPSCKFGPVEHFACGDLSESDYNVCPNCRFYSPDLDGWEPWDGNLPESFQVTLNNYDCPFCRDRESCGLRPLHKLRRQLQADRDELLAKQARIQAEQEAAEAARIQAEQEAAEAARIRAEQEAAEAARIQAIRDREVAEKAAVEMWAWARSDLHPKNKHGNWINA